MKRRLQAVAIGLLLLIGTISNSPCASTDPASPSSELLSSLVPTLEVLSDSCFVFDEPRASPYYFGPLRKGEKVKWLDIQDGWIEIWIPRLKISGWVKSSQLRETEQEDPALMNIPARLFTKVVVTARTANIRSDARVQGELLVGARMDQEFFLLNEKGGWYLVWISDLNRTGWVFGKAMSKRRTK